MIFLQILIISIGLSLDVFAYGLYKGAMVSEIRKASVVKMTAIFTTFQVGMLVIGNAITRFSVVQINVRSATRMWDVAAIILFFGLGALMIAKSFRKKYRHIKEEKQDEYNYRLIVFWALMTSLDALIAGVGFGFLSVEFLLATVMLGIETIIATVLGIWCGYRLGCGPMNRLITVGGCIVIIGGLDVLCHYMGIL